jgi:hypothetical protein
MQSFHCPTDHGLSGFFDFPTDLDFFLDPAQVE